MTAVLALYCAAVLVGTILAGIAYRRIWLKVGRDERVPTGFGALLAFVLMGAAILAGTGSRILLPLGAVTIATAIYWFDDAVELSARFRLLVAFVCGALIGLGYLAGNGPYAVLVLVLAAAISGLVSVALTNMVNFYDGADLNLGTFVALTFLLVLLFAPVQADWIPLAAGGLAFVLPFGVMNRRPKTIYLGDSGSFAFAGLLTLMVVAFVSDRAAVPPEAFVPAALPLFDVAYVFAVRVWERHDLLSRNYMHLYQRLNRRYAGFGYLLPQLINSGLCLAAAWLLQAAGFGRTAAVLVAMPAVTILFYFLCRRIFLSGPAEGPLQESRS